MAAKNRSHTFCLTPQLFWEILLVGKWMEVKGGGQKNLAPKQDHNAKESLEGKQIKRFAPS